MKINTAKESIFISFHMIQVCLVSRFYVTLSFCCECFCVFVFVCLLLALTHFWDIANVYATLLWDINFICTQKNNILPSIFSTHHQWIANVNIFTKAYYHFIAFFFLYLNLSSAISLCLYNFFAVSVQLLNFLHLNYKSDFVLILSV